ncbi:MAG TPA: YciI family protein [Pyrinomonadaceae bacterium]|nr:YciI family protein [Pyrinomonadaceae bacterium]
MPDLSSETRFMLILRGGKADRDFSPSEYGRTIQKYLDWIEGLRKKGVYEAGEPLEETGRVLSGTSGAIVTDGPFAESKETVGGYFIIKARDLVEATEIAKGCPIFESGGGLEVRQIAPIPSVEPA